MSLSVHYVILPDKTDDKNTNQSFYRYYYKHADMPWFGFSYYTWLLCLRKRDDGLYSLSAKNIFHAMISWKALQKRKEF